MVRRAGATRRAAFTLVELLVVIGIIAVLISILLPALNKARQQAIRTQCLSQMRQLGNGLMIYAGENKGRFPIQPRNDCMDFLEPATVDSTDPNKRSVLATLMQYMGDVRPMLACPVAGDVPWVPSSGPTLNSDTNYMVNAAVIDKPMGRVRRAAEVILIQEDRFRWRVAWCRPSRTNPGKTPEIYSQWCWENVPAWGQEYGNLHPKHETQGGGNFLFCDGHAEGKQHRALRAQDFGLIGGSGVTGNETDPNNVAHYTTYYGGV